MYAEPAPSRRTPAQAACVAQRHRRARCRRL